MQSHRRRWRERHCWRIGGLLLDLCQWENLRLQKRVLKIKAKANKGSSAAYRSQSLPCL